jgi:hypothetical protein
LGLKGKNIVPENENSYVLNNPLSVKEKPFVSIFENKIVSCQVGIVTSQVAQC